jgi:flagellar hook-associated protein 1
MTSILSGLDSTKQALAAQQFALSITQRNVANANNEAYTRQDAVFEDVSEFGGATVGIQTSRDRYIDYRISQELQSLGKQQTTYSALQQVDAIFNENSGQGLQKALSEFFNSFSSLSVNPEDLNLRRQVLSKASVLTAEFHRLNSGLQQLQASTDSSVKNAVDEINSITSRIATLNKQMPPASGTEQAFAIRDERQKLLENLSSLIDLSYYESESGSLVVMTRQGGLLVSGGDNFSLDTAQLAGSNFLGVQLAGADVTSTIQSGKLGGLIEVRNKIAGYLGSLDDMAATMAERVNEQHALGFDLNDDPGGDLLSFTTAGHGLNTGAARTIEVAISDPEEIAASDVAGASGSNKNANLLFAIKDEKFLTLADETANQFYASLIYKIGSDEKTADDNVTTQNSVLTQLKNHRNALSGVNLDEEAINLIKYQKAYQASAKFATVLDSLSEDILNILGV